MKRMLCLAILGSLILLHGCGGTPEEVPDPIRPVKTMTVQNSDMGKQWTFSGTAEDALATPLSFRVSGKIIEFSGDQIGRKFLKGETIARLDPSDYALQLRQARANMEQVRANYIRAKADLKRNTELFEGGVISRGEIDQIKADFKSYEAQLNALSKQYDIARKQLSYTTLDAPFEGWIGLVKVHKHQNVASGEPVVTFNAGRDMKMYIAVPDMYISQIHEGDDVEVYFDALPGVVIQAKVMEVSVDSANGSTYPVKVYLKNEKQLVRSGMSGHVKFTGKSADAGGYFVPPVAVVGNTDGTRTVWVVDPASLTVSGRKVTVGRLSSFGLEILTGVNSGDIIVIRGASRLKEGRKVRLIKQDAEGQP